MKRVCLYIVAMLACCQLSAQTYDELITRAMNAVERDSLYQAEAWFKKALQKEPANMRNALLFSNLGTIQRRMGKNKEALESYSLALNLTPYSVTMLLNRASLYLDMDYLDKAYCHRFGCQESGSFTVPCLYLYASSPIPGRKE